MVAEIVLAILIAQSISDALKWIEKRGKKWEREWERKRRGLQ